MYVLPSTCNEIIVQIIPSGFNEQAPRLLGVQKAKGRSSHKQVIAAGLLRPDQNQDCVIAAGQQEQTAPA